MDHFWVIGGEYADTQFREVLGRDEEWYGPFDDYGEAIAEWARRSWQRVDQATTRYRIERIDPEAPPPCTD